jgi:hypothetical protein
MLLLCIDSLPRDMRQCYVVKLAVIADIVISCCRSHQLQE